MFTQTPGNTHKHTHPLSLFHTHTHTHTRTRSRTRTRTLMIYLSLSLSLSLTHTRQHTHTLFQKHYPPSPNTHTPHTHSAFLCAMRERELFPTMWIQFWSPSSHFPLIPTTLKGA